MLIQCFSLKPLRNIYRHVNPIHHILPSQQVLLNSVSKRNIFAVTGIQPSGKPHLGNYLGVIKPCVTYCRDSDVSQFFMLIADLHSLTSNNCNDLKHGIHELVATLLACGFEANSSKQIIFLQSSVPGHTELAWILSSVCSILVREFQQFPLFKTLVTLFKLYALINTLSFRNHILTFNV